MRLLAVFFLGLFGIFGVSAQSTSGSNSDSSSLDNVFQNANPDTTADPNQRVDPNLYGVKSLKFFEHAKVSGYYVTGWDKDYSYPVGTPYNTLDFVFGTDFRVDPTVRTYAAFDIAYPQPVTNPNATSTYNPYLNLLPSQGKLDFSSLTVQELFLDYTLQNSVFFRLGRQTLTWGQGRIFNPGNFVNDIADGVAVKAVTNLWGLNVTGVAIKNDSFYNASSSSSVSAASTVAAAGLVESSWGWLNWGLSGFYQYNLGAKADLYLKSNAFDTDFFLENVVEKSLGGDYIPSVLAGAYHEFGDGTTKWIKIEAEYLFSGRGGGTNEDFDVTPTTFYGYDDQSVGLAFSSDYFNFVDTKPTLSWLTALKDKSGQLILGISNTAIPHLELSSAVAYIYGPDNGRYVLDNPDSSELRRLSFTFKVTFTLDGET